MTYEFMQRGTVRVPTAVLATGLVLSGLILILAGVMLTALNRRFRELDHRLTFLTKCSVNVRRRRLPAW